jgi:hypothetical protein
MVFPNGFLFPLDKNPVKFGDPIWIDVGIEYDPGPRLVEEVVSSAWMRFEDDKNCVVMML